jgi:GntR family transcriptional regulator
MTSPPSLRVATTDPTPPYEQLRRQFAELIGSGVLAAGDRLPPLRQLAADLGLAVGTVARTYRELEAAGLVASRRGGGTRVRATAAAPTPTRHPCPGPRAGRRRRWANRGGSPQEAGGATRNRFPAGCSGRPRAAGSAESRHTGRASRVTS